MSKRKAATKISSPVDDSSANLKTNRERRSATMTLSTTRPDSRRSSSRRPPPPSRPRRSAALAAAAAVAAPSPSTSPSEDSASSDSSDDDDTVRDSGSLRPSAKTRTTRSTVRQAAAASSAGLVGDVCNLCGKAFSGVAELERHLEVHSEQHPFQCPLCGRAFKYKKGIERHIISDHKYPDSPTRSRPSPPDVVPEEEESPPVAVNRKRKHSTTTYAAPAVTEPEQTPIDASSVKEERLDDGPTVAAAEVATEKLPRSPSKETATVTTPSSPKKRKKDKSRSRAKSKVPEAVVDGAVEQPADKLPEAASAPFTGLDGIVSALVSDAKYRDLRLHMQVLRRTCPYCGKVCLKPSDLHRHKRIHTGEQPFNCTMCERRFKAKRSMQYHLRSVHGATVELSPALEGKFFNTKKYRRRNENDGAGVKGRPASAETSPAVTSSSSSGPTLAKAGDGENPAALTFTEAFVNNEKLPVVPDATNEQVVLPPSSPVAEKTKTSSPSKKRRPKRQPEIRKVDEFSEEDDLPLVPPKSDPAVKMSTALVGVAASVEMESPAVVAPPTEKDTCRPPLVSKEQTTVTLVAARFPPTLPTDESRSETAAEVTSPIRKRKSSSKRNRAHARRDDHVVPKVAVSILKDTFSIPTLRECMALPDSPSIDLPMDYSRGKDHGTSAEPESPVTPKKRETETTRVPPESPLLVGKMAEHGEDESQIYNIASFRDPSGDAEEAGGTVQYRVQSHTSEVLVSRVVGVNLADGERAFLYKCHWCSTVFLSLGKLQSHLTAHLRKAQKTHACSTCGQLFQLKSRLRLHVCEERGEQQLTDRPAVTASMPPDVVPPPPPPTTPPQLTANPTVVASTATTEQPTDLVVSRSRPVEPESAAPSEQQAVGEPETIDRKPAVPFTSPLSISVAEETDGRRSGGESSSSFQSPPAAALPAAMQVSEDGSRVGYRCNFCRKMFDRLFSLHRHERIHTGVKPCFCTECGRGFSEPRNLRHHVIRFHSDGSQRHLLRRERHAAAVAAAAAAASSGSGHHHHHVNGSTGGRLAPLYSSPTQSCSSSAAEKRISYLKKSAIRILNSVSSSPPVRPPPSSFQHLSARSSPSSSPTSSFSDVSPGSSGQISGGERSCGPDDDDDDDDDVIDDRVESNGYVKLERQQQQQQQQPSAADNDERRPEKSFADDHHGGGGGDGRAAEPAAATGGSGQAQTVAVGAADVVGEVDDEMDMGAEEDRVTVIYPTDVPDVVPRNHDFSKDFLRETSSSNDSGGHREILSDPKRSLMGNLRKQQFRSSLTRAVNLVLAKSADAVKVNTDSATGGESSTGPAPVPGLSPPPPLLTLTAETLGSSFLGGRTTPGAPAALRVPPFPVVPRRSPLVADTNGGGGAADSVDSCEAEFSADATSSDGQTGNLCSWKLMNDVSSVISPISPPPPPPPSNDTAAVAGKESKRKKKRGNNSYFSTYSPRLNVVNKPVSRSDACKPQILPDGRMVFTCFYCHKTFPSASDVNRHMDFHEDVRPYKCNFCDYFSRTNSQLKVHMMRHQGIKQYLCEMCHYYGVTQSDLNRHKKTQAHCLRARNICKLCGLGYFTRQQKVTHMLTVHLGLAVEEGAAADHHADEQHGLAAAAAEEADEELRQRLIRQEALIAAATQGDAIDLSVAAAALAVGGNVFGGTNATTTTTNGHNGGAVGQNGHSGSDELSCSGEEDVDVDDDPSGPVDFSRSSSVLRNNGAANGRSRNRAVAAAIAKCGARNPVEETVVVPPPPAAHQHQRPASCFRLSITKENYDSALTGGNVKRDGALDFLAAASSAARAAAGHLSIEASAFAPNGGGRSPPSLVRIKDRSSGHRKGRRQGVNQASFVGLWPRPTVVPAVGNGGVTLGRAFGGVDRR